MLAPGSNWLTFNDHRKSLGATSQWVQRPAAPLLLKEGRAYGAAASESFSFGLTYRYVLCYISILNNTIRWLYFLTRTMAILFKKQWAVGSALLFLVLTGSQVSAGEVTVAVASNFLNPLKPLIQEFQKQSGHTIRTVSGSTGKLYAQILHGAPFDVFLSADSERPRLLEQEGQAVAGTRFTYARGKIVL
jgi:hypothetical protein